MKTSEPADLRKALAAHPKAKAEWGELTPLAKRDFVIWVNSAKQAETRTRRIGRTCDMLAKGKRRPCCFTIVPAGLYKSFAADPKAKAGWKVLPSDARRDLVAWIDAGKGPEETKRRINEASRKLAIGKKSLS